MARGFAFDVGAVLGVGEPDASPLPEAQEGEIVLRVSDGVSLIQLRDSAAGKELIWQDQIWYERYDWPKKGVAPGIYRLRIPVPRSDSMTFPEQLALLPAGEVAAPVTLVAAALFCLKQVGQPDPLQGKLTRCAESAGDGCRAGLIWFFHRVGVCDYWDNDRCDFIGLSSVRTS